MGFVTDVQRWFLDDLYREPRGGRASWLLVGIGVPTAAFGAAGLVMEGGDGHFLLLGVAFVTMGAAELVPRGRVGTARNLRIATWIAFVLYVAVVAGPPFLAASVEAKVAAVGGVLFLVVFGRLLYAILEN